MKLQPENRLTNLTGSGVPSTSYGYNGLGTRTTKSNTNGTRTYKRDGVGVTAPVLADGVSTMVPGISEKSGAQTNYLHTDRLGSMKGISNSANVTDTADYDAFGKVTSHTGTLATQKGFASGFGYQEDGESGYKLLGHRYYDADTGRFLNRDPIQDGSNWYAYCDNSPTKYVDPDGNAFFLVVFPIVAIIALVGVAEAPTGHEKPGDFEEHRMALAAQKLEVIEIVYDLTTGQAVPKRVLRTVVSAAANSRRPGRRGGKEHRAEVADAEAAAPPEWKHTGGGSKKETTVTSPDGKVRHPDLEFTRADGSKVYIQVGKGLKRGGINSRERDAISDIAQSAKEGDSIYYIPYYKPGQPRARMQ